MGRNRNNGIPAGWQGCPSMGTGFVDGRFFVFKTPLKQDLNNKLPKAERHSIENIFQQVNQMNQSRIGLWIDLTNTSRYYNPSQIQNRGIQYEKLSCEGHGRPPSKKDVTTFCSMVNYFFRRNRQDYVGVHCTHGFNRTGYLICYYLIKYRKYSAAEAVFEFSKHRHPGIYRQVYVNDLYTLSIPNETPIRVSEPDWLRTSFQNEVPATDVHSSVNEGYMLQNNVQRPANASEVTKEPSESHSRSQSSSRTLLPTPTVKNTGTNFQSSSRTLLPTPAVRNITGINSQSGSRTLLPTPTVKNITGTNSQSGSRTLLPTPTVKNSDTNSQSSSRSLLPTPTGMNIDMTHPPRLH